MQDLTSWWLIEKKTESEILISISVTEPGASDT